MLLTDYTGKLNDHKDYTETLKHLKSKTKYIEYVLVDEDETEFTDKFSEHIVSVQQKNKWWGTKSSQKYKVYRLKASPEIFDYLKRFETFCKYTVSCNGDIVERTDFGINDISFFDDNELPLLFTTTHEGYINIRDDFLNKK